jgi:hypothetical protein
MQPMKYNRENLLNNWFIAKRVTISSRRFRVYADKTFNLISSATMLKAKKNNHVSMWLKNYSAMPHSQ